MGVGVDRSSKNRGEPLHVGVLCDRMCDGMRIRLPSALMRVAFREPRWSEWPAFFDN